LTGIVPATGRIAIGGWDVPLMRPEASRAAGLARTFQSPQMVQQLSSLENVLLGSYDRVGRGLLGSWVLRVVMWRHERQRWRVGSDILSQVGVHQMTAVEGGSLSYGAQRLVEVGRAIASRPKVMILDEPSAGLNDSETNQLAVLLHSLRESGVALIVIDHKLGFLGDICDRLVVLQLGKVIAEGNPTDVWNDPLVANAYLGAVSDA
jgi:ABC-type branched-subunit amino acid transport system ATPase component